MDVLKHFPRPSDLNVVLRYRIVIPGLLQSLACLRPPCHASKILHWDMVSKVVDKQETNKYLMLALIMRGWRVRVFRELSVVAISSQTLVSPGCEAQACKTSCRCLMAGCWVFGFGWISGMTCQAGGCHLGTRIIVEPHHYSIYCCL